RFSEKYNLEKSIGYCVHFSGAICCLFFHQFLNYLISRGSGTMPVNNPQVHPQVLWIKNRRPGA
ncbi:MAG: hypothetical protein AB7V33_00010, partial [Halothiobacillus sp.]